MYVYVYVCIYYEMYLVCSCWREFGSEMKNRTLNIKKNGAEPEGITVGEREREHRTQSEEKDLKNKCKQQIFIDQSYTDAQYHSISRNKRKETVVLAIPQKSKAIY